VPNKFAKAAMDLACEAEMLLGLDHPNIVKIRGWATGGPAQYKEGKHTSYFLILDRLTGTLHDRIVEWRQQYREHYSWKRRLDYAWKRSKVAAGNCFRKHQHNKDKKKTQGNDTHSWSRGVHRSESFSKSSRSFRCVAVSKSAEELLLIERVKVVYDIACAFSPTMPHVLLLLIIIIIIALLLLVMKDTAVSTLMDEKNQDTSVDCESRPILQQN
jgi:hypothetical protein